MFGKLTKKKIAMFVAMMLILQQVFMPIGSMYAIDPFTTGALPEWNDVSPYRPLGSVHKFGAFIFGNLIIEGGDYGGYFHSEGGVAVRRNMALINRTTADFGGAHNGVGIQTQPDVPRLIIGGDFYADIPHPG